MENRERQALEARISSKLGGLSKALALKTEIFQREVIILTKHDLTKLIAEQVVIELNRDEETLQSLLMETASNEREACAKVAESFNDMVIASYIRNRSEVK